MKDILIKGGRIIDPAVSRDETADLLIRAGKIAKAGTKPAADAIIIDAAGMVVCPGFIDIHTHLREPGDEEKETIASGTRAAAKGGFTTVCCMPNTNPPLDNAAAIEFVNERAAETGLVRVLPIGCISQGRAGNIITEMCDMAGAGAVGFSDDGSPAATAVLLRHALEYCRDLDRPVMDHCEDTALTDGAQMNEGIIATRLGLKGWPAAAEEITVARDVALAEMTGGRLHICHATTAGVVDIVRRAKEKGIRVTCEVTPHHLTLTDEAVIGYNTDAKVSPPLRTRKDIDALIVGLKEGVIDAIATDHAPHTEVDKLCEFGYAPFGISGLETALASALTLVHAGKLPLELVISKLTCEPARIIGGHNLSGTLKAGEAADVAVFDPNLSWTVNTREFASQGRNTPLAGQKLKGRVMATICRGELVYSDDALRKESL
jgi:dihydroorotase